MPNSINKTKKPQVKQVDSNKEIMNHIASLSEKVEYLVSTIQSHAEVIKNQDNLIKRLRGRMGL